MERSQTCIYCHGTRTECQLPGACSRCSMNNISDYLHAAQAAVQSVPHYSCAEQFVLQKWEEFGTLSRAHMSEYEPRDIIVFTILFVIAAQFCWRQFVARPLAYIFRPRTAESNSLFARVKESIFVMLRSTPFVGSIIQKEVSKTLSELEEDMLSDVRDGEIVQFYMPRQGMRASEILQKAEERRKEGKVDWRGGHISGTVYGGGERFEEYTQMLTHVYGLFAWANPLHPKVFPGVRKMEAEVVNMCASMYNGSSTTCGAMTSGGTESILLAMKAYRDRAYYERGVTEPEVVVPESAHAAFDKACEYFRIKLVHIPVEKESRKASLRACKRAINSNTIAVVCSCPSFPHGVIDPVEDFAALARQHGIGCHVDCCLGSFVVGHLRKAGYPCPAFDFSVSGVTSISVDTHKYGFSPKGSSVILYSHPNWRKYQYSVYPNWPGGIYATPGICGSRAGAIIAATWAALMYHGEDGYVKAVRDIMDTTKWIQREIKNIPGLFIYGQPQTSVIAFGSNDFDINRMVSELVEKRHWDLNVLQFPASIHICVTRMHTAEGVKERFIQDLKESTEALMKNPKEKAAGAGAIYGMAASIPDRSIIRDIASGYIDNLYKLRSSS